MTTYSRGGRRPAHRRGRHMNDPPRSNPAVGHDGSSCRHDVTVVEARCPHNPLTRPARDRLLEDGTGINKRVILAVLTTWVGIVRKIAQQLIINFSAGERRVYGLRIDAGEDRLESQPDEGPHKLVGVAHPDRI